MITTVRRKNGYGVGQIMLIKDLNEKGGYFSQYHTGHPDFNAKKFNTERDSIKYIEQNYDIITYEEPGLNFPKNTKSKVCHTILKPEKRKLLLI